MQLKSGFRDWSIGFPRCENQGPRLGSFPVRLHGERERIKSPRENFPAFPEPRPTNLGAAYIGYRLLAIRRRA